MPSLPVSGAIAWWDATQIAGVADGALLAGWADVTGSGADLFAPGLSRPTYYSSTAGKLIHGNPVVSFEPPGNPYLQTTHISYVAQPYTVMIVYRYDTLALLRALFSAGTGSPYLQILSGPSSPYDLYFSAPTNITIPGSMDLFTHCLIVVFNGASSQAYFDGVGMGVVNPGSNQIASDVTIGTLDYNTAQFFPGRMGEAAIWSRALTSGEIATLTSYAAGKWGPFGAVGVTASLALGPLSVTSSGTISGTGTTITGTATLNLGPLTISTHSTFETVTASATALNLGPFILRALSGRAGPGLHPVPGWRGRWRLTLHTRPFAPATLNSTMIAELTDARGRRLDQAWNTPATLTFSLDGRGQAAAVNAPQELLHDVVAWRWDDQTGLEQPMFRGLITQAEDQISTDAHTVTYTCHDYAALLSRRLLVFTYTATGRDQDYIVADLLAQASSARDSAGFSFLPASFLPLSLFPANSDTTLRGLSGVLRDRTYYGSQNIGTALDDLAKAGNGFDYDVKPSAVDTTDTFRIFYPAQGVPRTDVTLQYGSTVAALTRTVSSADYANAIRVLGNNTSSSPTPQLFAEARTVDAATTTTGLWMLADDATDVTLVQALLEKAQGDLNLYAVLVPSYTLALAPDAYTYGHPNMGDTVGLVVQSGRLNVSSLPPAQGVRVLGISFDIGDDGQEDVTLTVSRPRPTHIAGLFDHSDKAVKALARK